MWLKITAIFARKIVVCVLLFVKTLHPLWNKRISRSLLCIMFLLLHFQRFACFNGLIQYSIVQCISVKRLSCFWLPLIKVTSSVDLSYKNKLSVDPTYSLRRYTHFWRWNLSAVEAWSCQCGDSCFLVAMSVRSSRSSSSSGTSGRISSSLPSRRGSIDSNMSFQKITCSYWRSCAFFCILLCALLMTVTLRFRMHPVDSEWNHFRTSPIPIMPPLKVIREIVDDKADSALYREFKKWETMLLEYDDHTPILSNAKHHCRALFFAAMAAPLTGRVHWFYCHPYS